MLFLCVFVHACVCIVCMLCAIYVRASCVWHKCVSFETHLLVEGIAGFTRLDMALGTVNCDLQVHVAVGMERCNHKGRKCASKERA